MKTLYGFVLCFVVVAGWVVMEQAKHFIEPDYTFGSGYFILKITVLVMMAVSFILGKIRL